MKISIVTPSLNQAKFIEETIKSVITQEGDFSLEYIIMDGASSDGTISIIKKYDKLIKSNNFGLRCNGLSFKWFSKKDSGQSQAINEGFKMCSGEVANWLCSDDVLEAGALKKVSDFFKENRNAKIVFGAGREVWDNSRKITIRSGREFSYGELIRVWSRVYHLFFIVQPSVFYKKDVLDEMGYLNNDYHLAMDYDLWLRFRKKYKFYYIPSLLSTYRFHPECKSVKFKKDQWKEALLISRKNWGREYANYCLSYYFFVLIVYYGGKILRLVGVDVDAVYKFFYK